MSTRGIESLDDDRVALEDTGKMDPVCGMLVDPNKTDTASAEYGGTAYFFCSSECKQQFLEAPHAFVAPQP